MAVDPRLDFARDALKLDESSRQVLTFVAAVFVGGGILTAGLDFTEANRQDPTTLQGWTLLSQTLAAVGLFVLARWRRSVSFAVLGLLITLIVIEEAFHVLNPVEEWLAAVAGIENRWNTVRLGVLNGALIYGFVALIGVSLLLVSHWHGSPAERRVVRNIAILLLIGGIFGGPISTSAYWTEDIRRVVFVEEVGETLVFAVMVGYIAGLLALLRRRTEQLSWKQGRGVST
jgi:hypothetical protein